MKKIHKFPKMRRKIAKIIFILSALGLVCSYVHPLGSHAAGSAPTGLEVEEETRFTFMGVASTLVDAAKYVTDLYRQEWTGEADPLLRDTVYNPAMHSYLVNRYLADYANDSTTGSYTIQDSFSFVAKRQLLYPYDDMKETDYLICFVDKNHPYEVQQFGDYYIAPNSILMIRQTSWDGTIVRSIPIEENSLTINVGIYGGLFEIRFGTPQNNGNFVIADETGLQYYPFRHTTGWSETGMLIQNNGYNNITDINLQTNYRQSVQHYNNYVDSSQNAPLDDFEAFIGTGYNYEYSQGLMNGSPSSWFISSGYLNISGSNNWFIEHSNNNIDNTINPKYAPIYIEPDSSPFKSGKIINENTVNNYNDYGITYNSNNNEFELDVAALGAALGAAITPTFEPIFDGTFSLQPEIGADFDLSPSLDFDYPSLLDDFISSITINGGGSWEPPSYPAVNTSTYIPATVPDYQELYTVTVDPEIIDGVKNMAQTGIDICFASGILGLVIPLVIFGLLWKFTGGD